MALLVAMAATITTKGQITIPLPLRQQFHLNAGDQIEFDEAAPVLTARRVVNLDEWRKTVGDWQKSAACVLKGHPWGKQSSAAMIDDLRSDSPDSTPAKE